MQQITDVVKHIILINVIMFIGTITLMPDSRLVLAMYYPSSELFKPFQIVTHMFMHADLGHLAFNMLGLFFLGPWVERAVGPKRFLTYYLACGLGSALLYIIMKYISIIQFGADYEMNIPVLGASGAVYGVIIGFATLYPNERLMLLFPPIPIKAVYLAVGLVVMDLVFGFSGASTGTAHFAHVGGAITGFLIMSYWKNRRRV